ncbi:MAG: hypothetical protein JOZ08_00460 [Verrucomicrobia bacterium]|nr:hypothetical protein [Verrucomicrobiota bacterium]MBV8277471.1 hypothetical protein [Verrucomicrobiota bacterium]
MTDSEDPLIEWTEFKKHRSHFFALIGHCVTQYQSVEDYLPDIFAAGLGINEAKAIKIFNHVRALENKLAMISEALTDAAEEHQLRWENLVMQIRAAAKARNQIAHAKPVHHGGGIVVDIGDKSVRRIGSDRMKLHKKDRDSEAVWTTEELSAEYDRVSELFGHLIAFVRRLKGQSVPAHLDDPLESKTPEVENAKRRRRGKRKAEGS